jgi:hypothetical protein
MSAGPDANNFSVYAEFAQELLSTEEARRTSLEQRGLAVITSSGVLATLGFGALVLAKREAAIPMPGASPYLLIGSAVALLAAVALALLTNAPIRQRAINPISFAKSVRDHAADDEMSAMIRVTATRIRLLDTARGANNLKAILCIVAMAAEVLGIALLGATVCWVILQSR